MEQMERTIKIEEEVAATSCAQIGSEIGLNNLKGEPGWLQSVKSESTLSMTEEILEDGTQTATIEQTEMTINTKVEMAATSVLRNDSEINVNFSNQDLGLLQSVKRELSFTNDAVVKEEILVDGSHDDSKQRCVHVASTSAGTGGMNEACRMRLSHLLNVKYESAEMDIGPTMLQHMDTRYTNNKNMRTVSEENTIFDSCNEAMPGSGVREGSIEDKRRDNKTTSHSYWAQKTKEDDIDVRHMESYVGQLKDFQQQLLLQHCATKLNDSKSHLLSVHNKLQQQAKPYLCHICDARYATKGNFNLHMKVHTGEKPYQCGNCDARFEQKGNLRRHMIVHTGHKPYQCSNCHARFGHKATLNSHMKVHTGEKPYQCTNCDARFAQRSTLNRHMIIHTGEKPYQCGNCDASFAYKATLNLHMNVHTGEKPYQCHDCDARFTQSGNLRRHMIVHTGEKPYQCSNCDTRFAKKAALNGHIMKVHKGEKPYQCNKCEAKFTLKSSLTQHMRLHTGEKPYQCGNCDARFAQKDI